MQAKPLAITIIIFGVLAFLADSWIASSNNSNTMFEQSQVAPIKKPKISRDTVVADPSPARYQIQAEDTLEITLSVAQKLQDLTLVAKIEKKLFRVKQLRKADIGVVSQNGNVTLNGEVTSANEKTRALRLAQSVAGVRTVVNQLNVSAPVATSGLDSE